MTLNKNTLIGEYSYTLDAKSRINIPSKFRNSLSKDNKGSLVITRGMDKCVWVYPLAIWKSIEDELRKLSSLSSVNRSFIRNTVRHASISKLDKQGRIALNQNIIKFSNIKKNALIITELPYQVSKAGWIEKLAELVNSGKIIGISDNRDESDRDGMRIVIELKKDSNSELVISNLYKKTTLQTNFGAIFLALIKGKPVQLNLKKYLNYFLEFREETIRKRTFYFLKNTLDKLEISEGLSKATKNINKVIEIIEESENSTQARSKLVENFFLSEKQANSVLDMPLKKLTNLEKNQIDNDIKNLEEKKNYFQKLLNERESVSYTHLTLPTNREV